MDTDFIHDLSLLGKSLERETRNIDRHMNTDKIKFMRLDKRAISTLNDKPLKFVDQFT